MKNPAAIPDETLPEVGHLINSPAKLIRYLSGTQIIRKGDPGDCAYMIEVGYVEISSESNGKKDVLGILGPGEIFGEMAVLDGQPRSATVTAIHETTLIPISREQLLIEIDRGGPITRHILIASTNRLRALQSRVIREAEHDTLNSKEFWQGNAQIKSVRLAAAHQLKVRFELERAIANRQFELAYQPIVALADGRTAGFEALLRWPRMGSRTNSPAEIIPLAEQSGMIVPLGSWALETALLALSTIQRKSNQRHTAEPGIFISVNVSPRQLENEADVEKLATQIEQANCDPACVKLEITEQSLLNDPRMATIGLARLKATGASIAIDDFGTGYSSLSYLHRFPIDTLKIDRSFISRIVEDESRQRVVAAIIGLARELDMDVVAEGVEQTDEAHWLVSQKCQFAQGYLMAKPAPFTTAANHLDHNFEF